MPPPPPEEDIRLGRITSPEAFEANGRVKGSIEDGVAGAAPGRGDSAGRPVLEPERASRGNVGCDRGREEGGGLVVVGGVEGEKGEGRAAAPAVAGRRHGVEGPDEEPSVGREEGEDEPGEVERAVALIFLRSFWDSLKESDGLGSVDGRAGD